jgi:ribonuclease HII
MSLLQYYRIATVEAGCDEAGRGCLAGPVFAAAVVLPPDFYDPLLNDSKKLTPRQRAYLQGVIVRNAADWAVEQVPSDEIDRINILNASILAMHRAISHLRRVQPELLLIDGNRFKPYPNIEHVCIVKGDGKYAAIAAASVLAKTFRDEHMEKIDAEFPEYGWRINKGYPTRHHRQAIARFGATPHHRTSFRLIDTQLKLFDEGTTPR